MIIRLPVQVKLFNEKSEIVLNINSTKKSQVRLRVHGISRANWQFGVCRVWYSKDEDFYNEFSFTNLAQLDEGLTVNTEKDLIDYLKGVIPNNYLEKRKLTPAQRRAIVKARSKSTMPKGARV
jgi:hypothetical protein